MYIKQPSILIIRELKIPEKKNPYIYKQVMEWGTIRRRHLQYFLIAYLVGYQQ